MAVAESGTCGAMQKGRPAGHRPQGTRGTGTGTACVGRPHGRNAAQDPHRLRRMPRLDQREPRRARGIIAGKPGAVKAARRFGGRPPEKAKFHQDLAGRPTRLSSPRANLCAALPEPQAAASQSAAAAGYSQLRPCGIERMTTAISSGVRAGTGSGVVPSRAGRRASVSRTKYRRQTSGTTCSA